MTMAHRGLAAGLKTALGRLEGAAAQAARLAEEREEEVRRLQGELWKKQEDLLPRGRLLAGILWRP